MEESKPIARMRHHFEGKVNGYAVSLYYSLVIFLSAVPAFFVNSPTCYLTRPNWLLKEDLSLNWDTSKWDRLGNLTKDRQTFATVLGKYAEQRQQIVVQAVYFIRVWNTWTFVPKKHFKQSISKTIFGFYE